MSYSNKGLVQGVEPELTYGEVKQVKAYDPIPERRPFPVDQQPAVNKYKRSMKSIYVDVYDVLVAFNVTNPATQHAIKKLLMNGERGHKNLLVDLKEAKDSITRAIELEGAYCG